jgi:hypothetical protein
MREFGFVMLRTFLRTNRLDFFAAQATRNIAYGEDAQWNTEFTDVRSPLLRVSCADLEGATALHLTAGLMDRTPNGGFSRVLPRSHLLVISVTALVTILVMPSKSWANSCGLTVSRPCPAQFQRQHRSWPCLFWWERFYQLGNHLTGS